MHLNLCALARGSSKKVILFMSDALRMSRKAFTVAVVSATIAWSVGLSALIAPFSASAAPASGTLVKASLPAVYYVGADGKRYVFPNEKTYKTWYADFSSVQTITDAELAALPIGGNVTYKPGVRMVKITTDPKVYAVDKGGALRWVNSEAVAVALYGANWNKQIDDVSDAFFTNYTLGADVSNASMFSPAGVSSQATSINVDKNLGAGTVTGSFSATLSSSQPTGGTLPIGATGVNVVKVDIRNNGSTSMTVDSLTVHRMGSGLTADIANGYVYSGNDRLTTGHTFNSSTNDASFSGLNLSLNGGETKTVWIAIDLSTSAVASDVHSFSITSINSGSTVAAGLPLSGPTFTISGATVGSVTVTKSGTITNPKSGQLAANVAEFQVQAGSSEDTTLNKIALYQSGSISNAKLSNFVLKQAGTTVATVSNLNAKGLAVFVLSTPMLIQKGNTKTFDVYADIDGSARSTDTIAFYLDQTTDVLAVGNTFGYGVTVTDNGTSGYDGTSCTSTSGKCSFSTVQAGQLTISFNGPAATNIASNSQNVELFNFTMAAQANLEVKHTQLILTGNAALDNGSTTTPRVTNIKIVDTATGAAIAGPKDATQGTSYAVSNTTSTLDFTEVYDLAPNTSRTFSVRADIQNTSTIGSLSTLQITLSQFSALSSAVRNLDASTNLGTGDFVPDSTIAGNTHTIKTPSLLVSIASTPVTQTYIQGTQGVPIAGISLKAGDGGDIHVNTLTLQGQIDTNNGSSTCSVSKDGTFAFGSENTACNSVANVLLTTGLWNGSTQISTTKSPSSSSSAGTGGVITFDNMNLTVPAGQTVTLTVSGNIAAALSNLPNDIRLTFRDSGTDNILEGISATDPNGNSVNATYSGTAADPGLIAPVMTINTAGTISIALAPDDTDSQAGLEVGGSTNAILAKYKFTAQREELKLTKARFLVATPNGVTSLSLYDGSTLVGGPVAVGGNGVADFSGMTFVVPKDGSKILTVKGNLNTVGTSGASSGADLTVTLADSDAIATPAAPTVTTQGTAGSTSYSYQVVAVNSLGQTAHSASGTIGTGNATLNGTNFNRIVPATVTGATSYKIYRTASAGTPSSLGLIGTISATASPFRLDDTGLAGDSSTASTTNTTGSSGTFEVRGTSAGSSTLITSIGSSSTNDALAARTKVLRKTKPTITLVSLPQTVLSTGSQAIMRFTVSADAAGDVSFKHIQVAIGKSLAPTLATTADANIRRVGDSTNLAGTTALSSALGSTGAATGTLDILLTNEEVVAAGTSRTYDVRLTISGSPASGDNVSSSLNGDGTTAPTETGVITTPGAGLVSVAGNARNFVWSDISAVPHSDTLGGPSSADFANGAYVMTLPSDTQTMSK